MGPRRRRGHCVCRRHTPTYFVFEAGRAMRRRDLLNLLVGMGAGLAASKLGIAGAAPLARFKLGFTTDEVTQDLEAALQFAREFGLRWVEIRNLWNKYVTDTTLDEARKAKELLDRYGIRLSVLDTAVFKCALPGHKLAGNRKDDYPWTEQEALLKRAIERSEILDTRFIRIFSFWDVEDPEAAYPAVIEQIQKAAELARKADRVLLVENVGGGLVESSAESVKLMKAVSSPHLGLAWDPGNAFCGGEKPFPDGYSLLDLKRVHHIHLRDAGFDPGTKRCQWLPVGKGTVDNLGLLRALVKDGFTGTLSLETHYQRPDKNKELATRESLQGLLAVVKLVSG